MSYSNISLKCLWQLKKYARSVEKKSRYEHSKRVARVCVTLARKFGLDCKKAYLMGISHDICKHYDKDLMLDTAKKDGQPIPDFFEEDPHALHGRAAAVVMKEKFNITDEQVLQAVSVHVTGMQGMNDYSKVLYIADKVEPGRKFSTRAYRKELFANPLNVIIGKVLKQSYDYVSKKGYKLYPGSKDIVDYYNR